MIGRVLLLLAAVVAVSLLGYWYVWPQQAEHYKIEERVIAREIVAPGVLSANRQVTITAKTPGFLSAINVDRNDTVQKGQSLAELDNAELRNQLVAAEANQRAAEFMTEEAQVESDRAGTALELAKDDFNRQKLLFGKNAISNSAFDKASSSLQDAKSSVLKAKAAIEQAKARAAAAAADAAALSAKLAETDIRSPIDGVVVSRNKGIGDLLAPGAELFVVVDPASIVVSARFDESTIAIVKPGQTAQVTFPTLDGTTLRGEVLRVMREVDPETREYTAEILLERLPENWAIGQRATVSVVTESAATGVAIPQKLLARQSGRPGVWILRNGRAHWAPVELGYVNGSDIEIRKGLSASDVALDPAGRFSWQLIRGIQAKP